MNAYRRWFHVHALLAAGFLVEAAPGRGGEGGLVVTTTADAGEGSLRAALERLNERGGGEVDARGLTGVIALDGPLPEVRVNLRLEGPTNGTLQINGRGQWPILAFANGTTSALARVTLTNGFATGYRHGGAISNAGTLVLRECDVSGHRNRFGWGGALYNRGDLTLLGCRFVGNEARGEPGGDSQYTAPLGVPEGHGAGGGGAGFGGAIFHELGILRATDSRFAENRVLGGAGGGYSATATGSGRGGGVTGGRPSVEKYPGEHGGFGCGGGASWAYDTSKGGLGGLGGGHAGPGGGTRAGDRWGGGEPSWYLSSGAGGGAGMGGAIFARSGGVVLELCTFLGNRATGGAGGAGILGAGGGGRGLGGALFTLDAVVDAQNCTWAENRVEGGVGEGPTDPFTGEATAGGGSGEGAAFYASRGVVQLRGCTFQFNRADGGSGGNGKNAGGGGLARGGVGVVAGGQVDIAQSLLVDNQALGGSPGSGRRFAGVPGDAEGGALAALGGELVVENCTLTGNRVRGADGISGGFGFPPGAIGGSWGGGLVLTSVTEPEPSPYLLSRDVVDLPTWVGQFQDPANGVSTFLWPKLPRTTRSALTNAVLQVPIPAEPYDLLVQSLNEIISGRYADRPLTLWDEARFARVVLRPETRALLDQHPTGNGLARLNRLLLEDAYPGMIASLTFVTPVVPSVRVSFSTVVSNLAEQAFSIGFMFPPQTNGPVAGGGLCRRAGGLELAAILCAGNRAATNADLAGTFTSRAVNLVQDPGDAEGFQPHDRRGVDPLLADLRDNGGPTWTHALLPGSPAIDALLAEDGPAVDQRGSARPSGSGWDLGAYEAKTSEVGAPTWTVLGIRLEDGATRLELKVAGSAAIRYRVEASTDLQVWSPVATAIAGDVFRAELGLPRSFYRLREDGPAAGDRPERAK